MKILTTIIITMAIFSRLFGAADPLERKQKIEALESKEPSIEATERRTRSISILEKNKIPTIKHLPVIEDSKTSNFRSKREIAERLIGCTIAAVAGETGDQELARQLIESFSAKAWMTPKEREFIDQKMESQQERVQFSWRYERVWVLLWSLGYIESLEYPPSICDVPLLIGNIKGKSVDELVESAKIRSQSEILDEADFIYRLHWAVTEERVNKSFILPDSIERGVVMERHAALNWLVGYMNQSWDDITTDT
ncbi:MAG: DUF4272 domain-containing protein [Opitutaceae bacterium]